MRDIKRNMKSQGNPRVDNFSSADRIAQAHAQEMAEDEKDLERLWRDCRRWQPEYFGTMDLEAFKHWNDKRLAAIDAASQEEETERSGTLLMANKVMLALLQELGGVPENTLSILIALKNTLVEDYERNPSDTSSREIYEVLKEQAELSGLREPGVLTPSAIAEQKRIQDRCGKQKLPGRAWGRGGVFP